MSTTAKTIAGALAALVLTAALTACAPTAEVPGATPESAAAAESPAPSATPSPTTPAAAQPAPHGDRADYVLPDGYEWPAGESGYGSFFGARETELQWACIRLDAAWAAIDAGDPAEADRLVAPVYEESAIWASDPPKFTEGPVAREWGWHGICTQQLGLLDYPVQGLAHWSPST